MRGALRKSRDVRLIVGAVGISSLGDFLLWVPLTLHLQEMTDSGLAVAALMICLWAPIVVLAPVSGLLVDRREARAVLIWASVAQALAAAGLVFALDSVAAILILAALLGIGFSVAQPAEFALVPVVGAGERLNEINGYVETARYAGILVGPVLGGLLAGAGGLEVAMAVNAASFAVVAMAGLALGARRPPSAAEDGDGDRILEGARILFRDPTLGIVVAVVLVSLLFMSASITAEVFFLKEDLAVADFVYGIVFSSWAAGMVIGALALARRVPRGGLALAALAATAVQGVGLGLPATWLAVWFAGAAWFVGGLGHGVKNVVARTLIQERVAERLHGRAFAAYNGMRNGAELIALAAGGLVVVAFGGRVGLALAGGLSLLTALVGLAIYARRRGTEPAGSAEPAEPAGAEGSPVPVAGAAE